uniref:Uncharacterized protein n=1 Tax=Anguilla anguilla TaxID=7936 RepID=A0A0E9XT95_ANGAN
MGRGVWDEAEQELWNVNVWLKNLQELCDATQSAWTKFLRNIASTFLNPFHEEFRQVWTRKGVLPSIR